MTSLDDVERSTDGEETGDSSIEEDEDILFDPKLCIFCNYRSGDFDENYEHMCKAHGFSIPNQEHLIVEVETLIKYLHLVVFGYYECLLCGSQRNTSQGAQQHMTGKRHCKIDIDNPDSEYRDFYDLGPASGKENELYDNNASTFRTGVDKTLRLSSGKVLSHRTTTSPRPPRKNEQPRGASSNSALPPQIANGQNVTRSTEDQLTKQESSPKSKRLVKREAALLNQLATLRATDRNSLAHLPVWKQRALVERSMKETEHAMREENAMKLKIQLRGNKTAKK